MKHRWQLSADKRKSRIKPNTKRGKGNVDLDTYADAIIKSVEQKEKRALEREKYE